MYCLLRDKVNYTVKSKHDSPTGMLEIKRDGNEIGNTVDKL